MKTRLISLCFIILSLTLFTACSETHEEKMANKEKEAQEKAELLAASGKGVGNALSGVGSEAAESISQGATNLITGVGRGIEKGSEYKVTVNEPLAAKGLNATVATRNLGNTGSQTSEGGVENSVSVYIIFNQPFNSTLQLRAYDNTGMEIGRSNKLPASFTADDASYLHFKFDGQTPLTRVENMKIFESSGEAPAAIAEMPEATVATGATGANSATPPATEAE